MERASIMVFGGQKGGCGKSTLATNFAVEAKLNYNADVLLIDSDPQKTCLNWSERRNENENLQKINCIFKDGNLKNSLEDFATKYDLIIVDTAGHDNKSLRTSLFKADILITPLRTSQADLETIPYLTSLISEIEDFNENLKHYFILTMVSNNPNVKEADEAFDLFKNIEKKLLKNIIFDRKIYRDALLEGKSVIETSNNKAKSEIQNVFKKVFNL